MRDDNQVPWQQCEEICIRCDAPLLIVVLQHWGWTVCLPSGLEPVLQLTPRKPPTRSRFWEGWLKSGLH